MEEITSAAKRVAEKEDLLALKAKNDQDLLRWLINKEKGLPYFQQEKINAALEYDRWLTEELWGENGVGWNYA